MNKDKEWALISMFMGIVGLILGIVLGGGLHHWFHHST